MSQLLSEKEQKMSNGFLLPLLAIAVPAALQNFVFSAQQVLDTIMVARLNDEYVAALAFCGAAFLVITSSLFGIALATSALVAQHWGAIDYARMRSYLFLGIALSMLVAVPAVVLFVGFPELLMSLGPDSIQVRNAGVEYLQIAGWSILLWPISVGLSMALNMIGQARLSLLISVAFAVITIVSNYVLIFGWGPIPKLEIRGAAFGTLGTSVLFAGVYLLFVLRPNNALRFSSRELSSTITLPLIRKLIAQSTPLFINGTLWAGGLFTYNVIFSQLGTAGMTVIALLAPIITVSLVIFNGLATGANSVIGNALGRKDFDYAWNCAKSAISLTLVTGACTSLCMLLLQGVLPTLYSGVSQGVFTEFESVYTIAAAFIWVRGLNIFLVNGLLRTGADNDYILKLDTISSWGISIPLTCAAVYAFDLSLIFVYLASLTGDFVKMIFYVARVRKRLWLRSLV
ncbi:MATE family efflux transporter [Rhizobium rhizogenes]|nr:MATE family efflux transporter [Rhizobium rhizogenes]